MTDKFFITETDDYESLVRLFIDNELEYSEDDSVPTHLMKCWKAVDQGNSLVGGCVLGKREGRFICDGIAVDPSVRGERLGEKLLGLLIDEVKAFGGESVFLVARAPGFFAKFGFAPIPRSDAPTFFECFSCPQFGAGCEAVVMRLNLLKEKE